MSRASSVSDQMHEFYDDREIDSVQAALYPMHAVSTVSCTTRKSSQVERADGVLHRTINRDFNIEPLIGKIEELKSKNIRSSYTLEVSIPSPLGTIFPSRERLTEGKHAGKMRETEDHIGHAMTIHVHPTQKKIYFNDPLALYSHEYHQEIERCLRRAFPDYELIKLLSAQQVQGEECCRMIGAMNTHRFATISAHRFPVSFLNRDGIVSAFPSYVEKAHPTPAVERAESRVEEMRAPGVS